MSQMKAKIERAADYLHVEVDALTEWLADGAIVPVGARAGREARTYPDHLRSREPVDNGGAGMHYAGRELDVHPVDLSAWWRHNASRLAADRAELDASTRRRELVDTARDLVNARTTPVGAARFIDPADDGCCAALDDVRDLVEAWRNGDLTPQDAMDSIARRTEI